MNSDSSDRNLSKSLYCEECKAHIPLEHTEDGLTVIHCPKCVGECAVCDCHLAQTCFSDPDKVIVRHAATPDEA